MQAGETMRIFTGAKMPNGADTVVMQEKVILEKDTIYHPRRTTCLCCQCETHRVTN